MKFKFDVRLTDKDYLDYNTFWLLKSPYGKMQISKVRKMIYAIFGVGALLILLLTGMSIQSYVSIGALVVLCALFQLFANRFFLISLKFQIKTMKKSGKMPYSAEAVLEFDENSFTETTPENKSELKYSCIERVSIVGGKIVYIHVNNLMAFLLPFEAFENVEEYNRFFDFIKTKVSVVDIY